MAEMPSLPGLGKLVIKAKAKAKSKGKAKAKSKAFGITQAQQSLDMDDLALDDELQANPSDPADNARPNKSRSKYDPEIQQVQLHFDKINALGTYVLAFASLNHLQLFLSDILRL